MAETKSNYEVGYGRPPVQHRWKPGQSGNSQGRPRKQAQPPPDDLLEALVNVLLSDQPVRIDGVEQIMPTFEALARSIVQDLLKAGPKDKITFLKFLWEKGIFDRLRDARSSAPEHAGEWITEEERMFLAILQKHLDPPDAHEIPGSEADPG